MKWFKDKLEWIKKSKGFLTARGKWINYREAHKLQYGFILGIIIFRPSKLQDRIRANDLEFLEFESSNSHYVDLMMLSTYIIKLAIILRYSPEAFKYAILGA